MKGSASNGMNIHSLILSGLNYLDTRTDFWQQHKPIYARKRDKLLMQKKWDETKQLAGNVAEKRNDMLKLLEKSEELIEKGDPVNALQTIETLTKKFPLDKQSASDAC